MYKSSTPNVMADIAAGLKRYSLVGMLGWQDVRQRYRRSALGPFWLTISMGVMIATIGIVFGQIFSSPIRDYLPFLAIGMVFWAFISAVILEGCTGFIAAEGIIKQLPIPLFVHILRLVWRNIIILGQNLVIIPLTFLAVGKPLFWSSFLSVGGLAILAINLTWMALLLAVLCARYRDLPQTVASILQVIFYLTPIMWMPSLLPQRAGVHLLNLNPFYHFLEIIRGPLVGQMPSMTNWLASLGVAIVGWALALAVYGRYKRRIAYWL